LARSAYLDAVALLARRELSEAQVRQRLARRGHSPEAIDTTIDRLKTERAIDDERVAEAIARTQAIGRRRGARRVRQQIEQAGIASTVARRVVDETFDGIDQEALVEAALRKRLRGAALPTDRAALARLYRYLLNQGFEPEQARACFARHNRTPVED
jgi:regulatory protein